MGVTVWDRLSAWGKDKLEEGFEEGASIQIKLATGEDVPQCRHGRRPRQLLPYAL
jgi:hypothetical protein